jgi:hypothetical protein
MAAPGEPEVDVEPSHKRVDNPGYRSAAFAGPTDPMQYALTPSRNRRAIPVSASGSWIAESADRTADHTVIR